MSTSSRVSSQLPPLRPLTSTVTSSDFEESFAQQLKYESRALFLTRRSSLLSTSKDMEELCILLENSSPTDSGELDYNDFKRIANLLDNAKVKNHFTVETFGKLSRGNLTINSIELFNYLVRKEWFWQTRITLSLYDQIGDGFLHETDVESYIKDLMPTLPQIASLDEQLVPFYVCVAVRKFFFFLDPYKTGKIRITDILESTFLDSILELRDESSPSDKQANVPSINWFSSLNVLKLYDFYVTIDTDSNGMLNKKELAKYGEKQDRFTESFIERVFEETVTYDGEIDFKGFVDFYLAINNKHEPQSLYYFFKILDINRTGYLDKLSIYTFFKDIDKLLTANGQEEIHFHDIYNEILDIVKPADVTRGISFNDLVHCGQGDVVITLLTDFNGFKDYENREVSSPNDDTIAI